MRARVRLPVVLLAFALVYGTLGYRVLEGFALVDALYMTVTTLTTVGFGEIQPLSTAGRVFTISLILVGVVVVFDLFAVFTSLVASGHLTQVLGRRSMERAIDRLEKHYIICAYGRVGQAAARELTARGAEVVVVESQPDLEPLLQEAQLPYVIGDSTHEAVLERAGSGGPRGCCARSTPTPSTSISPSAPECSTLTCSSSPGRRAPSPSTNCAKPGATVWYRPTSSAARAWPLWP